MNQLCGISHTHFILISLLPDRLNNIIANVISLVIRLIFSIVKVGSIIVEDAHQNYLIISLKTCVGEYFADDVNSASSVASFRKSL